jgi:hypothetical protein
MDISVKWIVFLCLIAALVMAQSPALAAGDVDTAAAVAKQKSR